MDKVKIAKAIQTKKKALAKKDYYNYIKYTHEDYLYNKHGEFIANTINNLLERRERMLRGEEQVQAQYLMLSLPP